jgi:polysaccharide export outer membrane protein
MRYFYYFLFGLFSGVLIWIHPLYAQGFQAIPIQTPPQTQTPAVLPQQQGLQGQPQQGPVQLQTQPQVQPQAQPQVQPQTQQTFQVQAGVLEEISDFEQYVSEKIVITDTQFEILKKWKGINFSYISQPLSDDKIAVPIKVIKGIEKQGIAIPVEIDAGFIIGTSEAIATAFKTLGIKSSIVISTELKQFGHDIFRQPPTTFAPVDKVPVGPDYVIGPGDEIRINVWGRIEGSYSVVVDRDGNIAIPKIGVIGVTGLTFKELKEVLQREFSKYYTGFEMNVSMGQLRTIRVYVVGHAERPGAYTVSSLSTLVNALFEAGGPSKTGSMRNIEVKRNGKTIVHFDMYDLLLRGDKTKDIRLMSEDVIYIPPVGPLVAIAGSVKRPAIYELKDEKTVKDIIEMAGGLSDIAFRYRVQIERIFENSRQIIFEADFNEALSYEIKGGDLVKIFQVFSDKRYVRISGAVQRPGEYGYKEGLTMKELLMMAGGFKYFAYTKSAELTRVTPTQEGPKTEKIIFSPEKALEGDPEHNIKLQQDDYIFIRAIPEWDLYKTVQITGEVKFPGTYTIKKGERLSDLLKRAGGFTDKAYLRGAVFTRPSVKELQQKQIDELIDRLERELLSVSSATVATAMTPEEAKIFQTETEQKRQFLNRLRQVKALGRIVVRLDEPERLVNTPYDIELEEGDSIYIPSKSSTIQVIGSVYNQTAFIYSPEKDLSDYIDLAGGYTENADKGNLFILKVDGSAVKPGKGFFGIRWNKESKRWELGGSDLEPGDTIVVPEKLTRIAWMREIKDITQILYQIAVTAGVLIVAF